MSKVTKNQRIDKLVACLRTQGIKMRELETRLSTQEKWSEYADNMLTELKHALPDPEYDAKCEAQEADVDASLARRHERLGLNKPQLKQLDQSVFDGADKRLSLAAIESDGRAHLFEPKAEFASKSVGWWGFGLHKLIGTGYDTSNWQNSLIERDIAKELAGVDLSSELTGSELCKAMINRGDKYVMCVISDISDADALISMVVDNAMSVDGAWFECFDDRAWKYAIPINNQGEPLTAGEVGL